MQHSTENIPMQHFSRKIPSMHARKNPILSNQSLPSLRFYSSYDLKFSMKSGPDKPVFKRLGKVQVYPLI